jgi:N-acetylneuraminic acid mutarotase
LTIFSPLSTSFGTADESEGAHIWTEGSPMPTARTEISSTIIDDKIYVVGGTTKIELTGTTEVYDPSLDEWSADGILPLPLPLDHAGLDSYNGKLYLVGGFTDTENGSRIAIDSLFIYDSVNNKWKEGSPMHTPRAGLTAKFIDGIFYAIGGSTGDNEGPVNFNEAYNPVNDSWSEKAPMPTARHHITSEVVDGKLYVIGGRETSIATSLDVNEMYDPVTDRWLSLEPMPTKRSSMASAYLNGAIYVLGGEKEEGSFDTNERYNIKSNEWTEDIPMPTGRLGLEAEIYEQKIYVIGGKETQSRQSATDVNEIFYINSSLVSK